MCIVIYLGELPVSESPGFIASIFYCIFLAPVEGRICISMVISLLLLETV